MLNPDYKEMLSTLLENVRSTGHERDRLDADVLSGASEV
jgi:hypothetical protein